MIEPEESIRLATLRRPYPPNLSMSSRRLLIFEFSLNSFRPDLTEVIFISCTMHSMLHIYLESERDVRQPLPPVLKFPVKGESLGIEED